MAQDAQLTHGVTLRPGQPADIDRVAAFAFDGMQVHRYPGLRADKGKVRGVVAALIGGAPGFHLAALNPDGELVGIVAAVQVPMLFFERSEAVVVACRAIQPGAGRALLRELKTWAQGNPAVRRVIWPIEFHSPKSTVRLAQRLGFTQVARTCTFEKE